MENPGARNPNQQKKNMIHIEYCTNCQSHNWNTHHNQAKYHETYIKLKNLIESCFKQNPPIIAANKVPHFLLPIKEQENKYYNQLTKKYMFFPNIGSFEIILNDQLIFSKKKTNNWPCFDTLLNEISMKLYQQPFEGKMRLQKNTETNQTEFSSDQKIISQGCKTLYKHENKNSAKNFGKFTLTDHFRSFHGQNKSKAQEPAFYFDSSTTIKQSPEITNKNKINVQDIDGLRKALMNTVEDKEKGNESNQQRKKSNDKQILINLCSIEQQGSHIKELPQFRVTNTFKKTSALVNSYPVEMSTVYNGSQKSLSLQRFQELNNDLKKIEKQFQHIEKKMIINGKDRKEQNESVDESRINNQIQQMEQNQNLRKQSHSGFVKSKFESKENFLNYHLQRYSKENRLLGYIANLQNSEIKVTDRYDDRYISPTYYEENELHKNVPSKKYSQIQKYLKANNEEKNKKLKKIYGDWKVGSNNLNYLNYIDNGKKVMLRDSTNTNSQIKQKHKIRIDRSEDNSSEDITSEQENIQCENVREKKNSQNQKATVEQPQINKHSSFIIKNKSLHKNYITSNSKPKLSKYSRHENTNQTESRFASNKNGAKNHHQSEQNGQLKQAYMKPNSKSFQVFGSKTRPNGNPFVKREKYSLMENTPKFNEMIEKRGESRQSSNRQSPTDTIVMKKESSSSKSKSFLSSSNSNDPTQRKISQSSKEEMTEQRMKSFEHLSKIQQTRQVQLTEKSANEKCSNKITIEFHEFQLKIKSTRRQKNDIEKQQECLDKEQNDEKKEEEQEKRQLQKQEQEKCKQNQQNLDNTKNEERIILDEKKKEMSISRQVYVQLNLNEMNLSQIMKTKPNEGQVSSEHQNLLLPHLNLHQNHQDHIKSNTLLKEAEQNIKSKSCSSNSLQVPQGIVKTNPHSRSSSLYQQPTFCHAVSHDLHQTNHCKCEERIEQLQTNRIKMESQRKEKQLIKEKKYQENQKRKELIDKEKQHYLKQLQIQIKEKNNSHLSPQKQPSSKRGLTQKKSLQKQPFSKDTNNQTFKDKRALSNNVQGRKSPFKKIRNEKTDEIKQEKNTQPNFNQNKPLKSMTQKVNTKSKEQISAKKPINFFETNSKGKSTSKNTLKSKTNQSSQPIQKESQVQKVVKNFKKQSKSVSSKIHEKQKNLTKKGNNQRNKSYFMTEKQKNMAKSKSQEKEEEKEQNLQYRTQNQVNDSVEVQKQLSRSKCATIAVQTIGFDDWKKYSQHEERQNTRRNKSVQSRHSSVSVKSARQSIKSVKNKEIIKETYSPIEIEVKGGKTKVQKVKKQKIGKNSKISKRNTSKSQRKSQSEKSQVQSQSEKTIVNIFEEEENPQELISELDLDHNEEIQISYKGERQKAMILKQLYNMDKHLLGEMKQYENLYQQNKLYQIVKESTNSLPTDPIFQSLIQSQENKLDTKKAIYFTQVEKTVEKTSLAKQLSLFGKDSISINKLKSNGPYLTRNLHKVLHILSQKNELLIVRLFQDYKSEANILYQNGNRNVLLQKSTYAVWLCINKTWKLIVVDNVVPARVQSLSESSKTILKPLFSYHQDNQLWPQILQKCIAKAVGGYTKLFELSIGQLFSMLTGSNNLAYTINQNLSKNKLFIKEITENDKKNFIMVCEKHPMNLKEQNDKTIQTPKLFYLISKKIVHNGQNDQILFKIRESILDESNSNPEPYYIRYDKFCQKFKTCQVLHLRQHNNFCFLPLNQTIFTNKNKKSEENFFNVVELIFDEQTFGTITVCNEIKSDIKTYLYKLQNSDNQIMKLVGQASKLNKKQLFFDCYFQQHKYLLFIQSSNPNSVVSFMGEGRPEIKIKQQILSNGLKNQSIEYLPVSNYEGIEAQKNIIGKTANSNFYSSHVQSSKKLKNMDDLREMFIELLIEEKKKL